jgi:hypothetical protein
MIMSRMMTAVVTDRRIVAANLRAERLVPATGDFLSAVQHVTAVKSHRLEVMVAEPPILRIAVPETLRVRPVEMPGMVRGAKVICPPAPGVHVPVRIPAGVETTGRTANVRAMI